MLQIGLFKRWNCQHLLLETQICSEAFLANEHFAQMSSQLHIGKELGPIPHSLALSNDAEICVKWSHIVDKRRSIFSKCGKAEVVNLLDSRLSKADFYTNLLCAISSRNRVGPAWPWLSWRPGLPWPWAWLALAMPFRNALVRSTLL